MPHANIDRCDGIHEFSDPNERAHSFEGPPRSSGFDEETARRAHVVSLGEFSSRKPRSGLGLLAFGGHSTERGEFGLLGHEGNRFERNATSDDGNGASSRAKTFCGTRAFDVDNYRASREASDGETSGTICGGMEGIGAAAKGQDRARQTVFIGIKSAVGVFVDISRALDLAFSAWTCTRCGSGRFGRFGTKKLTGR